MAEPEKTASPPRRHIRNLTLADLNPSPLAHRMWSLISTVAVFLEPFFRPLIRTYVVACLRIGIQLLPMLSQALSFDLQSVVLTFAAVPEAKIVAEQISIHASVDFTQLEPVLDLVEMEEAPRPRDPRKASGMSIWKRRLTESFHRSLDRAWGMTKGTAAIALKIHNISGTSPGSSLDNGIMIPFLLSTGVIDLSAKLQFSPRAGTVEPHSFDMKLATGHCSAKVDTLNALLKKLIPDSTRGAPASTVPTSVYPSSPCVDTPTSSFPFSRTQPSPNFSSALPTSLTPNFSPTSTPPLSSMGQLFSSKPLTSPIKALSAKMRPRSRYHTQPCFRLKSAKNSSLLSILKRVEVSVASIALSVSPDIATGPYKAVIQDAQVTIDQSDHNQHDLQRQFLGRNATCESFDAESYAIRLSLRETTIERQRKQGCSRLLKLGVIEVSTLVHQWPSPWLVTSPFIRGDPNAALLAIQMKVEGIEVVEQLDHVRQLIDDIQDLQLKTQGAPPPSLPAPLMVPRISFAMECGPIFGRIIYQVSDSTSCNAMEMRTRGFTASLQSNYTHSLMRQTFPGTSDVPVRLECNIYYGLEPTFFRTRLQWNSDGKAGNHSPQDKFMDDPPMLSIGMVELFGTIQGFAEVDVVSGVAIVDRTSLISDLHLSIETICIEFWHQVVVDSFHHLLSILPEKAPSTVTASPTKFNRLPVGLAAKVAVSRLVVFVTAPDINPGDKSELSRGLALRAGVGVEYCSLHTSHDYWFEDHRRTQTRTQLSLPAEPTVDAITAARASGSSQDVSAFIKIRTSDLILKSAIATQFEPDEPAIAGREDVIKSPHEFLCVGAVQTDVCLSYKDSSSSSQATDTCNVSIHIPDIRADFQLVHIYSVLLALQTLRSLSPPLPPRHTNEIPLNPSYHKVQFMIQTNITVVQVLWALPQKIMVTRIDGLTAHLASDGPPRLRMHKAVALVPLPSQANRWEDISTTRKWGELIDLHVWEICFSPHAGSLSAAIEGESLRLRIPPGFVVADLIYDAIVTVKALRHIAHMATVGCYSDMPPPEPEGPKIVPHLTFRLNYVCLEALDDPFESKLSLIWQAGAEAVRQRVDREEAFLAKVAAIQAAEPGMSPEPLVSKIEHDYQFGAKHSISIQEARKRLDDVHALDWTLRLEKLRERRSKEEGSVLHKVYGTYPSLSSTPIPDLVSPEPLIAAPPLLRVALHNLSLTVSPPSFPTKRLADFLHDQGGGVPKNTLFSLLIPMHIHFTLSSLQITLRDHPLPLVHIPSHSDPGTTSWTFDSDLVVGEEMGTSKSVDWVTCPIIEKDHALHGEAPLSIKVPKTIMPIKTYANPVVKVNTSATTVLSWGVSYGPVIQDVMRIVETLTTPQRDSSPPIGFWDKMRLVFHWSIKVTFASDVQLYLKGSRDPHSTNDVGAGFVLSWQGNPEIHIAHPNEQRELIQVMSDVMLIAVPDFEHISPSVHTPHHHRAWERTKRFQKVCAQLSSGVRYGIGFVPERSCGPECTKCRGTPFHRNCRHFNFRPHFEVKLERKIGTPIEKGPEDSFNGFRSDFVHLSVSLASSIKPSQLESSREFSSLHLTPKIFAHFWSWWALFDGVLSLPVRQGTYHPTRPISPKLSRHIATIKYRISVPRLYFMHGYMDNSRETWVDGVTSWVGVKGMVDEIQADMHQREEELIVPGAVPNTTKVLRRKPFYAAQVLMRGLDLRTLLATFVDPMKQEVLMTAPSQRSNYRKHTELPLTPSSSWWYDLKDFVELDWDAPTAPTLHLLPLATCPRFTYFKQKSAGVNDTESSKFGSEKSHGCFLGEEPSVSQTQMSLALARAQELRQTVETEHTLQKKGRKGLLNVAATEKMIILLEKYAKALRDSESGSNDPSAQSYCMVSEIVSPAEWAEFENVYQIHCPSILMDDAIRDIMMQYYYCSRARRGIEYHMSTRAVKFIRDQANAALAVAREEVNQDRVNISAAQVAASALLKLLKGDSTKSSIDLMREKNYVHPSQPDPLEGWDEGVSLRKSHCCLLLKPQIVLRGESTKDTCVVAAAQAKLQSFAIMDVSNLDDPVSGKVMSRNYTTLSGLQSFSPTHTELGSAIVPLEVLIDLRCESSRFERIVPQTDATFHYDKFNRLRLRNQVTSIATRVSTESTATANNHLQAQTDLIRVHIPRFTVTANEEHFQAISNILTKLLLFSDAAHKTRTEKLETLIFTYDFTDLVTAANVVTSLQCRLRDALETDRMTARNSRRLGGNDTKLSLLKLRAHIFHLAEELNLLFDAIKLAQDRFNDQSEQNSALLLHTSSSEISWKMLDERRNLLSKLVVQNIDFRWLSRQDSSTVNHLAVGNLTAFDGSRYAIWAEILSKHDEPANHPLLKRGLFLLADWTVLAPVGGITIYESFELSFHPLRLQIDAKVGRRIMEYLWPDRKQRIMEVEGAGSQSPFPQIQVAQSPVSPVPSRSSLDSPRALHNFRNAEDSNGNNLVLPLRRLGTSRSFTDLRSTRDYTFLFQRNQSSDSIDNVPSAPFLGPPFLTTSNESDADVIIRKAGDAAEMKTRSSQKSFVLVRVSSLNLLLSIVKEGSFECHDARIRTRELEYRNQTWSFEELVNQFIPSNLSWRGWVKMAFHQPLLPVLPVAKELISKTKWTKGGSQAHENLQRLLHSDEDPQLDWMEEKKRTLPLVPNRGWRNGMWSKTDLAPDVAPALSTEAEALPKAEGSTGRKRVMSLFRRGTKSGSKEGMDGG